MTTKFLDSNHSPLFCRYRFYTDQTNLPICGNLDCPSVHQRVLPAICAACKHQHPDDLLVMTSEAMDIFAGKPLPEPPPDPPAPTPEPRPDLQAIVNSLPADDNKDRTFKRPRFWKTAAFSIPRQKGTGNRRRTSTATRGTKRTSGSFIRSGCPAIFATKVPTSKRHAGVSKSYALQQSEGSSLCHGTNSRDVRCLSG